MNEDNLDFENLIRILSNKDNSENRDIENDVLKENNTSNNSAYKTLISYITSLPSKQFILLSSLIGILLIDNIDTKDQFILGKFINNIGQTILTAAAQEEVNKRNK